MTPRAEESLNDLGGQVSDLQTAVGTIGDRLTTAETAISTMSIDISGLASDLSATESALTCALFSPPDLRRGSREPHPSFPVPRPSALRSSAALSPSRGVSLAASSASEADRLAGRALPVDAGDVPHEQIMRLSSGG